MKKLIIIFALFLFAGVTKSYAYTDSWSYNFYGADYGRTVTQGYSFSMYGSAEILVVAYQANYSNSLFNSRVKVFDSQSNLIATFYYGEYWNNYESMQSQYLDGYVDIADIEVGTNNVSGCVQIIW